MATKKDRDYSQPFTPPRVTVTLVEGDRLKAATAALNAQQTEATRAEQAAVETERAKLQPTIEAAKTALVTFHAWERANASDLKMLRSLQFDGARGIADEQIRVSAANRVEGLGKILSQTRDALTTAEARVAALSPRDLEGPRMSSDAPGIRAYDDLPYAATAQIEHDVARAVRTTRHLDQILDAAKGAVQHLAANLEKRKGVRDRRAAVPGTVPASGSIVQPEILDQQAAGRPGNVQTSYGDFDVFDLDRNKR